MMPVSWRERMIGVQERTGRVAARREGREHRLLAQRHGHLDRRALPGLNPKGRRGFRNCDPVPSTLDPKP